MSKRFWSSLVLSLLVVAACVYVPLAPQTTFPFSLNGQSNRIFVAPSAIGLPMPPGFQDGDEVDLPSMSVGDRLAFSLDIGTPPAGTVVDFHLKRGGQSLRAQAATVEVHLTGALLANVMLATATTWMYAALGLLLLWRGQRQAAFAVCLWCLLNVLFVFIGSLSLAPSSGFIVGLLCVAQVGGVVVSASGVLLALYMLASDLTGSSVNARVRAWMRYAFIVSLSLYTVAVTAVQVIKVGYGTMGNYPILVKIPWLVILHLTVFAVPLGLLAICYRSSSAAERVRIRWVLLSIGVLIVNYLLNNFGGYLLNGVAYNFAQSLLSTMTFVGLTYAVLRHRMVSLQLVLNRTLVYGVITSLVVGVFAAISSIVDHFAVGRTESFLLQALVPLSLGVTLNLIKKRLDGFVERLFFRRQYRAETALTRFIRECGFIEARDRLLDRTVDEVLEYLKPTGVALYERTESGYGLLRQRGERRFPASLQGDDDVMVSLRASLAEADLDSLMSALGKEGLAFPLAVRGVLLGALILGERPAEHYTQAERALLAGIGQQVAAALNALRAREAENFVDAVARGAIATSPEAQTKAQRLLQLPSAA